jgi:hypothetical protein
MQNCKAQGVKDLFGGGLFEPLIWVSGTSGAQFEIKIKELRPDNNDPIQPTVAENAFVQVIMMFRKIFIQDSVVMMELHPCYPIWQHSIFSDPAFVVFQKVRLHHSMRM